MQTPTLYVNIHEGALGLEAHEAVHTSRAEAADAAEQYAESYRFTLTDTGKVDLTAEFSEGYHERQDFDAAVDARIDGLRELGSFTMQARA